MNPNGQVGGKLEESEVELSRAKKNPNGAGTIRRRPGGRWEGRYSNGFDKDGKQIQKSIYGATQQEVRQKLAKVVTEIDDGTYIEPSKMKLSEWLDLWLKEYCGDKKYSTVKNYRASVKTHIKPQLGSIPLGKLTAAFTLDVYGHVSDAMKTASANRMEEYVRQIPGI